MEDFVFIGHLRGHRDARRADDPNGSVPYLHLHPCCQLILLFEDFLQLTLYLRPGIVVIQGREKRGQLPRVVFNGVKVILILVVSGVVLRGALDFFVQLFFQFLIVLLCAPDVPVLGGVDGLPGNMRSAGKQNRTG